MKLMFASDIHGSAYYCEKMLECYRREKAERLWILGDILYHGPRNDLPKEYAPKKVIAMLNDIKEEICAVRGNCDTEVDQMVLEFPILADYSLLAADGLRLYATHGHVYNEQHMPPLMAGDILIHGHTHIYEIKKTGEHVILNPGSVSIPKENSEHSYMILETGAFWWKTLDGETYLNFKGSKPERGYCREEYR